MIVAVRLSARKNREIINPRADFFFVLFCHDASDLPNMIQIMGNPGCQELVQSHGAEIRVPSFEL